MEKLGRYIVRAGRGMRRSPSSSSLGRGRGRSRSRSRSPSAERHRALSSGRDDGHRSPSSDASDGGFGHGFRGSPSSDASDGGFGHGESSRRSTSSDTSDGGSEPTGVGMGVGRRTLLDFFNEGEAGNKATAAASRCTSSMFSPEIFRRMLHTGNSGSSDSDGGIRSTKSDSDGGIRSAKSNDSQVKCAISDSDGGIRSAKSNDSQVKCAVSDSDEGPICGILMDFDNDSIPADIDAAMIKDAIENILKRESKSDCIRVVCRKSWCNLSSLRAGLQEDLVNNGKFTMKNATGPNKADHCIIDEMKDFRAKYEHCGAFLVLGTGDGDFIEEAQKFASSGISLILLRPMITVHSSLQNAANTQANRDYDSKAVASGDSSLPPPPRPIYKFPSAIYMNTAHRMTVQDVLPDIQDAPDLDYDKNTRAQILEVLKGIESGDIGPHNYFNKHIDVFHTGIILKEPRKGRVNQLIAFCKRVMKDVVDVHNGRIVLKSRMTKKRKTI